MHEAQLWEHNCFITLTYDDQHLPQRYYWGLGERGERVYGGTLRYSDWMWFLKRLRKALGRKGGHYRPHILASSVLARRHGAPPHTPIRFYVAGEYGEKYSRPHWHGCMFNLDFNDKRLFKHDAERKIDLYESDTLTRLWGKGHASIGVLNFETAAYTARYIMKKRLGDNAELAYLRCDMETGEIIQLRPEMAQMSRKPGLGAEWLTKFQTDVYPEGKVVVRGHEANAPKYYDKLHKRSNPDDHELTEWKRHKESKRHWYDNTNARLKTREQVAKARINQLKRNLE